MFRHFDVGSRRYLLMRTAMRISSTAVACSLWLAASACTRAARPTALRPVPAASVQVGSCARPERDGVLSNAPRLQRADKDLNGDGVPDAIVSDRALCTEEGNCYWNVFVLPSAGTPSGSTECARYVGTFEARALEPLATTGDEKMADVRGYWNLHGGRFLLQSYRFLHGGYRIVEALLCKRERDDRLECADSEH
jgi:hypothetical protein